MGKEFQRWGTDIAVRQGGRQLRLLSGHLVSGCWGVREDGNQNRRRICETLRGQIRHLTDWADARRAEGTPFAILGDFNRRLGVAATVATSGAAPAADVACAVALRSPIS